MVFRTIFFGLFLLLAYFGRDHALPLVLYFGAAVVLAFRPLVQPFFFAAYGLLFGVSAWALWTVDEPIAAFALIAVFAAMFFALGTVRSDVRRFRPLYETVLGAEVLAASALLFAAPPGSFGYARELLAGLVYLAAMGELLAAWRTAGIIVLHRRRMVMLAVVMTFFLLQFFWVLSLLPVGFLNLAAALGLAFWVGADSLRHALAGTAHRTLVLRNASVFAVVLALVLGLSKWSV